MLPQDASSNMDIQNTISALLRNEIDQLEALREVLEVEKNILGEHDAALIEDNTSHKKVALSNVEQASQKRFSYLRQIGINPLAEGWFEELIPHLANKNELTKSFDYLVSLTNRCRSLNQTNGLMINRREMLTSKVINILRANNTPEIYSGSGQSESKADTRMIGKA